VSYETLSWPAAVGNLDDMDSFVLASVASTEFVDPANYICIAGALDKAWNRIAPYEIGRDVNGYRLAAWVRDDVSMELRKTLPGVRFIVHGTPIGPYVGTCYIAAYKKRLTNTKTFEKGMLAGTAGGSETVPSISCLLDISKIFEDACASGAVEVQWTAPGEFENTARWASGLQIGRNPDGSTVFRGISRKMHDCAGCDSKEASSVCSKCRKVHYCSKECQIADWRKHRATCSK